MAVSHTVRLRVIAVNFKKKKKKNKMKASPLDILFWNKMPVDEAAAGRGGSGEADEASRQLEPSGSLGRAFHFGSGQELINAEENLEKKNVRLNAILHSVVALQEATDLPLSQNSSRYFSSFSLPLSLFYQL